MSERGVVAIDRGLFDHPSFADEPFTEREAWAWLIMEAAWRPRSRRIGRIVVELERGQLAASLRFMAERWHWGKDRVATFLGRLERDGMIQTSTATGIFAISLVNYDAYQRVSLPNQTVTTTVARQADDKRENIKSIKPHGGGDRSRGNDDSISPEAFAIADEVMAILGIDREFVPPGWCGAPMRLQAGLNGGWKREVILIAAREVAHAKRDGPPDNFAYLEKPIARAHARLAKPVPTVIVDQNPEIIREAAWRTGQPNGGHRKGLGFSAFGLRLARTAGLDH